MAATIKGIDVSMYQTNVDFAKVKAAGYSFVIIRCNNWDHTKNCVVKDPLFETHYKNAKAAGLDVGAYYYTWQTTGIRCETGRSSLSRLHQGQNF